MKRFFFLFLFLAACKGGESVVINAPIEAVWNYASDSNNAKYWSIYFDHISPLPGIPDGQVGSLRRCFRRADESGMFWDEEVKAIRPFEYRQIRTYNVTGHREKKLNSFEYNVEQHYEKLGPGQTRLTFQADITKGFDLEAVYYLLRDFRESSRIFRFNLENIKSQIENQSRPHAYEAATRWD